MTRTAEDCGAAADERLFVGVGVRVGFEVAEDGDIVTDALVVGLATGGPLTG